MTDAWLNLSKLIPPDLPGDALERQLWPPGKPLPPVMCLVAGPGYGKTLALRSLVDSRLAEGQVVLWYAVDALDADLATFFHYLIAGMRRFVPQFGEDLMGLLAGDRADARLLWQRFFAAVSAFNLPETVLVLDDVHHLLPGAPELLTALAYHLDKLPPSIHVLLSSRSRLSFPVGRAQALGNLHVIAEDGLRFSSEEEVAFMARRAPDGQIPDAWWRKATGLDGWPLGLALATQAAQDRDWRLAPRAAGVEPLMAYVAEELYEAQSDPRRRFMLRAALMDEMQPEVCRALLAEPEAAEILAAREADHLVRRLADGLTYRFPAYLLEFLRVEAERTLPATLRAAWHQAAARHFADRPELAFHHWIAAGDWQAACAVCEDAFPAMRFSGRHGLMTRWLEAFPGQVSEREPLLSLWRGHLASTAGLPLEARVYYEQALALYEGRGDHAGALRVRVRQVTIGLLHEELRVHSLRQLLDLEGVSAARDDDLADLCLARSLAAEQAGDLGEMRAQNLRVLGLPIAGRLELAASHCIALLNLFTIALHQGDLAESLARVTDAARLAEQWGFAPYRLHARFMQAHVQLLQGEWDRAGAFLRALPDSWSEQLDWHDLACAHVTRGLWHHLRGEARDAEDDFRKARDTFARAGNPEGQLLVLERQLWLSLSRRQPGRALSAVASRLPLPAATIYDLALMVPLARALHLEGRLAEASEYWNKLIAALEAQGARWHLTRAYLYRAATDLAQGANAPAQASLAAAMRLAEAGGYRSLVGDDPLLWEEIASLVTESGIGQSFAEAALSQAAAHAVQLGQEAETAALSPLEDRPVPGSVRGRLSLRCLGSLEARRDGVLIDHWPRRKAKWILSALLLHPRGLTLSQLSECLGGGALPTQAALTTLKVDVSALRRVLEPNLAKGQPSSYVLTQDDRYVLNWELVEFFDLRCFEEAGHRGDRLKAEDAAAAAEAYEEALRLLRGGLLEDGLAGQHFEAEREQVHRRSVGWLIWLASHYEATGASADALRCLTRAVTVSPTDEEPYVAMMGYQQRMGRPDRIRQVYWDCRKALKSRLGLAPSPHFEACYTQLATAKS
ncbi:MAG: BTAD domain-containing putative transcriptional regulator [Candidatus Sericytochromatia bacterium]|nr:BTAD domain-containing putative transcriptional regulator [Candidatus Sericytochromatia bacterium]